jgi:hypothetical protein
VKKEVRGKEQAAKKVAARPVRISALANDIGRSPPVCHDCQMGAELVQTPPTAPF